MPVTAIYIQIESNGFALAIVFTLYWNEFKQNNFWAGCSLTLLYVALESMLSLESIEIVELVW